MAIFIYSYPLYKTKEFFQEYFTAELYICLILLKYLVFPFCQDHLEGFV